MNIGSVIRGLFGNVQAGETKKLELQTGQVVRGTVVKISADGGEALLQIQGIQVRARVETPLQEGQMVSFQVQPAGTDGMTVLKPLSQLLDQPLSVIDMAEVLQTVKLPDTPQNRELIQFMQRSGIALTTKHVEMVQEAAAPLLSGGAGLETIVQAAAIVHQRGVLFSPEAVAGVHQVVFGPPLGELLSHLEKLVEKELQQGSGGSTAERASIANAAVQTGRTAPQAGNTGYAGGILSTSIMYDAAGEKGNGAETVTGVAVSSAKTVVQTGSAPTESALAGARSVVGRALAAAGAEAGVFPHAAAGSAIDTDRQQSVDAVPQAVRALLQELRGLAAQQLPPVQAAGSAAVAAPATTHRGNPWVELVLKLLGAEHEQRALRAAVGLAPRGELPTGAASAARETVAGDATVKGLLLQLLGSSSVSPTLKEAAQQVVQQQTGQQLLLSTERTAPFAQVHLFIPFVGSDGRETASVQIQSRRGRRGALDSSNCRLWFDLDMKAIGLTAVDVQVANRIVSVTVHNDSEWAQALLDRTRESITEALHSIGYQLLTLKAEPLPLRSQTESGICASIVGAYSPQVYKGVDLKV